MQTHRHTYIQIANLFQPQVFMIMFPGPPVLARAWSVCPCPCPFFQQCRVREAQLCAVTHRGKRSPRDLSGSLTQIKLVLDFATEKPFRMSWCGAEQGASKDNCNYTGEEEGSLGRGKYTLEPAMGTWEAWVGREGDGRERKSQG